MTVQCDCTEALHYYYLPICPSLQSLHVRNYNQGLSCIHSLYCGNDIVVFSTCAPYELLSSYCFSCLYAYKFGEIVLRHVVS